MHFARITSALAFLSFGISSLAAPVGHAPAELAARSPKPLPPVLSTALTTIAAAHVKLKANAAAKAYGKVATQLGVIAGALLDADVDIKPDVGASLSALLGTWDYQKDVVNVWATILADVSLDIQTAEGLDGHTAIKTQLDAVLNALGPIDVDLKESIGVIKPTWITDVFAVVSSPQCGSS